MATRFINVTMGALRPDNTHNPVAQIQSAAASHLSIQYDDTVITSQALLIEAVRSALASCLGNRDLTR